MKNYKIAIAGLGMVGTALSKVLPGSILYDPPKGIGSEEELNKADIVFITVPTPTESGKFNLEYVLNVLETLEGEKIVVIKSTILPGTTDKLQILFPKFKLLFNPEFLTEANADMEMLYPERQIVGYTEQSRGVAEDIMVLLQPAPYKRIVPAKVAEMSKYMGNSFLGVKVVFANQIYDACQKLDIDYEDVKDIVSRDSRIGKSHLNIWHDGKRGYGGHCLPKDIKAFIGLTDSELLKTVDKINETITNEKY